MTTVEMLLINNFQLVAPEKPINPNKNVTKDIPNMIFNGCMCAKLFTKSIISLDDIAIKKSDKHTNENINDQKLIFAFIVTS